MCYKWPRSEDDCEGSSASLLFTFIHLSCLISTAGTEHSICCMTGGWRNSSITDDEGSEVFGRISSRVQSNLAYSNQCQPKPKNWRGRLQIEIPVKKMFQWIDYNSSEEFYTLSTWGRKVALARNIKIMQWKCESSQISGLNSYLAK